MTENNNDLPLEDWDDTAEAWMNAVLLETDDEARAERLHAREETTCTS
ncbi:MAG: hypothetical protein HC933_19975 [Pleurocapsa sp. SU_196_0]|nr:hypothetical protein [Pleurocapsa sp. SU_196_0]